MQGGHSHDHGHGHGHAHGHAHGPASFGRAFALGAGLNARFVTLQVAFGLAANSTALLADAAHNAGDVLGLLAAWGAARLTLLRPTERRTYGWGRSTILAALGNAVLLLLSSGAIALEAVQRLLDPQPVAGEVVAWVAAAGIAVNGGTALLFLRGQADLNVRGAFLHLMADAAVSAGVVLASSDPRGVTGVIRLSRASYRKMVQNLAWAAGYNVVAIPLAAGVLAWAGMPLATREVAEICELEDREAREQLGHVADEHHVGADGFWMPSTNPASLPDS